MNINSNISLIRGETTIWKFQRKDSSGAVITDVPDEMYCSIKANYDDSDYVIQKSYTDGDITYADGWWTITLSASDTLGLNVGKYVVDVKLITSSEVFYVVHPQTLSVLPCVTEDIV